MLNREKNVHTHFWVTLETSELVKKIAMEKDVSMSCVYRDLIEKGLVASGYKSGVKDLTAAVKCTVEESLQPHVDRLAAISAKAAQISAAAFFLAAYNGRQGVPDYLKDEYDEIAASARKLGIEYLKLSKDKSLDEFIGSGLHRMDGYDR